MLRKTDESKIRKSSELTAEQIDEAVTFSEVHPEVMVKDVLKIQKQNLQRRLEEREKTIELLGTDCSECDTGLYEPLLEFPDDFTSLSDTGFTLLACQSCGDTIHEF